MAASFTHHVGMSSPNWTTSASDALRAGAGLPLAALDPAATPGFTGGKAEGAAELEERGRIVGELQVRLFAQSVAGTAAGSERLVLQPMDTGRSEARRVGDGCVRTCRSRATPEP